MLGNFIKKFFKRHEAPKSLPDNFQKQCEDILAELFFQHDVEPIPVAFALSQNKFTTMNAGAITDYDYKQKHKIYQQVIAKEFENRINSLRQNAQWPSEWLENFAIHHYDGIDMKYTKHIITGKEFPHLIPTTLSAHTIMAVLKQKSQSAS